MIGRLDEFPSPTKTQLLTEYVVLGSEMMEEQFFNLASFLSQAKK